MATVRDLIRLYNSHKNVCAECGCTLTSDNPLGSVFVIDKGGNFYCTKHDKKFKDGDERIFDKDLYEFETIIHRTPSYIKKQPGSYTVATVSENLCFVELHCFHDKNTHEIISWVEIREADRAWPEDDILYTGSNENVEWFNLEMSEDDIIEKLIEIFNKNFHFND